MEVKTKRKYTKKPLTGKRAEITVEKVNQMYIGEKKTRRYISEYYDVDFSVINNFMLANDIVRNKVSSPTCKRIGTSLSPILDSRIASVDDIKAMLKIG